MRTLLDKDMTQATNIKILYFKWLCQFIRNRQSSKYKKLLTYLFGRDFYWTVSNDGNRVEDGLNLRNRFAYGHNYDLEDERLYLSGTCNVLEMMVALSIRCEESIMDDPEEGNRTGEWFWSMISSLGLSSQTDDIFDEMYVEHVVNVFLDRKYSSNGNGSLFSIHDPSIDMRRIEIWYQMCFYLDELLDV